MSDLQTSFAAALRVALDGPPVPVVIERREVVHVAAPAPAAPVGPVVVEVTRAPAYRWRVVPKRDADGNLLSAVIEPFEEVRFGFE
jgi:hypothetical protein